jgi:hypothetical protein
MPFKVNFIEFQKDAAKRFAIGALGRCPKCEAFLNLDNQI